MLDFEEELKKFQPSLEVEELGDAIYQDDLTDMTDLLREVIEQTKQDESTVNCGRENIEGSIWITQQNWRISRITGIMTDLTKRISGI